MSQEFDATSGRRLTAAACCLVLFFRVALPLFGFRRLTWLFPKRHRPPVDRDAARVATAVRRAARLVPGAGCLVQACAARALFTWRGYAVIMRVGVREDETEGMIGHAWLLAGDRVILGSSVDGFQQFRPIADFGRANDSRRP